MQGIVLIINRNHDMKLHKIFKSDDLNKSKKRDALKKCLHKLEKKQKKIEEDLKSEDSKKKSKKLETKLKTNKRQREKAKKLIAELD